MLIYTTCIFMCIYIFICIYIFMCIYIYICIYICTDINEVKMIASRCILSLCCPYVARASTLFHKKLCVGRSIFLE